MPKPPQRLNALAAPTFAGLFGGDDQPGTALDEARLLPLELIEANPHQPRQLFNDPALDDLAESIRTQGVLQPILVRPVGGDRYQIVAGERRVRAADRAGLREIPAIIRPMTDEAAAFATATENLQREDLDPEDEARQYQYLLDLSGLSGRQLAERLGKGRQYVNNRLALLQYPYLFGQIRLGELTQEQALAHIAALNQLPGRAANSDAEVAVAQAVPLREDHSNDAQPGGTERAVLDAPRPASPTAFRWRPLQQFATWLERTPPASVPTDERATVRAQLAAMREQLEAWERALGEAG